MGTVELDDRGRITIPKELRDRLHLEPGDRLEATALDGGILLSVERDGLTLVTRDEDWGAEAFPDSGEATFGE